MSRPPLVVRSLVPARRYLTAVAISALGGMALAVAVFTGDHRLSIIGLGSFLVLVGPGIAANTFLGYPRLVLTGDRLLIETTPFTIRRYDLDAFAEAYLAHTPGRRGMAVDLVFRTRRAEAAHRSAEKFPFAPEPGDVSLRVSVTTFVADDVDKGEALAAAINTHRGLA